jgi:hypothetical protein
MASMPVETKMTGRQFVEAVVMGIHFPPVRVYQNPNVSAIICENLINNTTTQWATVQF